MEKPEGRIIEVTENTGNLRHSSSTIAASEWAVNDAILSAEISESDEEYLEIFDRFYPADIQATADGLKEPVEGKAAVRAWLAGFLVPLHVVAKFDGVSVSIQSDEKRLSWVTASSRETSLLVIVPLDYIWITANFKQTQLKRMRPGQSVTIHVDTFGRDYKGKVEGLPGAAGSLFRLYAPEDSTGNYVRVVQRVPVRLRLDKDQDAERLLRPGMSVEPTVDVR